MSQDKLKKLQCTECKFQGYRDTRRIKGDGIEKLNKKKYCSKCRKHQEHKEMKK